MQYLQPSTAKYRKDNKLPLSICSLHIVHKRVLNTEFISDHQSMYLMHKLVNGIQLNLVRRGTH